MTLWPASTSRRAICAPILPRPMKPMSMKLPPSTSRHLTGAPKNSARTSSECSPTEGTAAARRSVVAPRRRRIRYRPARRVDSDTAQMRVVRQVPGAIDACKGNIGGGEPFFQRIGIKTGEGVRDLAVGFGAAFDALDIGGEVRIGCERGVAKDFVSEHAPFAIALNRYENVDPVAAAKRAIGRD